MQISTFILTAALLAPGTASFAQVAPDTKEQIVAREQEMWTSVKSHNLGPLRAALDSSYVSVTQHGVHGSPVDAGRFEWTNLDSYQLSDFETRAVDSVTVLLTYKAQLRGNSLGNRVAGIYWMATMWRQTDGKWLAVFHSEVKGG